MRFAPLAGFPVIVIEDVSWGDMDSFQHVGNTVYFEYFQNARIDYMTRLGWFTLMKQEGLGPIVASTQARFRKPVTYPDRIHIGARVVAVESDRVTFEHRLVSERWGDVAAEGQCVIVSMDYKSQKKTGLPASIRAGIERLESAAKMEKPGSPHNGDPGE